MSRYTQSFLSPFTPQQVHDSFASYLASEGFKLETKKGESYWKKGVGLLTAPQYLKLSYANGVYVLEAWLKMAILPGVYLGEMALDNSFVGCIPKSMLQTKVDKFYSMVQAQFVQPMQGAYCGNMNIPQPQGYMPPQGNMNIPQPQGYMPPQGNMNIPQSQGYMPPQGNMNIPQPQGYIPPQGNPNIPQPQGYMPPQGNMNIPQPQNNQTENYQPANPYNQG